MSSEYRCLQIGALHVTFSSVVGIILSHEGGGAGFNLTAAMQLQLSYPERFSVALLALASLIALFLFSTREADQVSAEAEVASGVCKNMFLVCWFAATVTLVLNTEEARDSRTRNTRSRDQVSQRRDAGGDTTAVVVVPAAWSFILVALSFISYTAPQIARLVFSQFENLRGVLGAFCECSIYLS